MQKITVIGNLGKEPEERFLPGGKKLISFSLAVTVKKDKTQWYDCVIWDRFEPIFKGLLPHLKKGSRVVIVGDLALPKTYVGKDGITKVGMQIEPQSINFVGGGEKKQEERADGKLFADEQEPMDDLPF